MFLLLFFFGLDNMGLLLLIADHIQNIHYLPVTRKNRLFQLSKIQKNNALPRHGKPEPYSVSQKPSQAGYCCDYIPGDTMHNRESSRKQKTQK